MAERSAYTKQYPYSPIIVRQFSLNPTGVEIHEQRYLCRVKRIDGIYGGYMRDILTENLSNRDETFLICGICNGIMREACVTISGEQICSCCKVRSHSKQTPNEVVKKTVNSLKCSCPLLERGCEWLGTLKDCEEHLDTCGYVRDQCKLGCGTVLHRNELRAHEQETCPNRKVKCKHCIQYFTFCDLTTHHKECPKMELSCELKCGVVMCHEDMAQHLEQECVEKIVMCPFVKYNCEVSSIKLDWNIENLSKFIQINHIPELRNVTGCDISIHFLKEHIYVSYPCTHGYSKCFSAKYLILLYSTIKCKVVKQYDCGGVDVYGINYFGEYDKSRIARILKSDAEELSLTGSANKLILEIYITKLV